MHHILRNRKGISLIEVLLALMIFSAAALPLTGIYVASRQKVIEARRREAALFLAQAKIEELQGLSAGNIRDTSRRPFSDQPGYEYSVEVVDAGEHLIEITVTVFPAQGEQGTALKLLKAKGSR